MANPIRIWLSRASRAGVLAGALLVALGAGSGRAAVDPAASDWFVTDQGKVRLIAADSHAGREAAIRLGLEFHLAEGWKIYWRSPGDAGLPPTVDWTQSTNLASTEIAWPAPQRFSAYGLETVGYEGTVVLPITAHPARPGEALGLHAALQYLTCKEICIPYDAVLTLDLPASGASGDAAADHAALIDRFAHLVPGDGAAGGLALAGATVTSSAKPMLELALAARAPLVAPDVFVEGPAGLAFGAPRVTRGDDKLHATLTVPVSGDAASIKSLTTHTLRFTVVDGAQSLEAAVVPKPAPPPRGPSLLPPMLAVALLGGFILNFMPCVLPVLSIKLLSVTAHAGRSRRAIRGAFLASALGILASFLVLAAAMLALRAAGIAVGWGMQFQQPVFLTIMIALCAAFAGNLAGFFEIPLPPWLAQIASSGGGEGSGFIGDFAAGAFATLLATPCSAPFLGTAIGFALAGNSSDILATFLALGIGLALPYFAVAALPAVVGLLPRPGRWMLQLRRVLAVLLAATALWLITVLAAQTSLAAALAVAATLLVAALVPRLTAVPALRRIGIAAACLAAIVAPLAIPVPAATGQADGTLWRRFDAATIDGLVRDGKVVFVDVTADWCINCKVNEHLVLQSDTISQRLSQPEIVAMRADWTRPDQAIGAFLRGFGRYGIPFYAVFGPATPEGQALPEILTGGEVLAALRKAAPDAVKSADTAPRAGNGG